MPSVRLIAAISGEVLIPSAAVHEDGTLEGLAIAAAEALGAKQCRLVTSDRGVLAKATTFRQSGLKEGDTLLAAAVSISDVMLRTTELLVEYYHLRCQNAQGLLTTCESQLGLKRDKSLLRETAENLRDSELRVLSLLRRLPEEFDPNLQPGFLHQRALEQKLFASHAGLELPLPDGLTEFFDIHAWLCSKELDESECTADEFMTSLGDLEFELADTTMASQEGCVLASLASIGYDDYIKVLCMEWRPGRSPRYVALFHCDEDDLDTLRYSFSDGVQNVEIGDFDLMADEVLMKTTTTGWRLGIYDSFADVLQAMISDICRRRDGNGEGFFLIPASHGTWKHWGHIQELQSDGSQ